MTWTKEEEDKLINRNEGSIRALLFNNERLKEEHLLPEGIRSLAFQMMLSTRYAHEANQALGELGLGRRDEVRRLEPLLKAATHLLERSPGPAIEVNLEEFTALERALSAYERAQGEHE